MGRIDSKRNRPPRKQRRQSRSQTNAKQCREYSPARRDSAFSSNEQEICRFYQRTGSCRHWTDCSKLHIEITQSQTIVVRGLYECQQSFYEDALHEFNKFGEVHDIQICVNSCAHLSGNVYVRYRKTEDAIKAYDFIKSHFFLGKYAHVSFLDSNDISSLQCSQYRDYSCCERNYTCNFPHFLKANK